MPVRIYDISKKLGLENKEILARAKALGIAARVPSSSLDKITAEYLEGEIRKAHPELSAPPPAAPPAAPIPQEPIRLVTTPPPPVAPPPEPPPVATIEPPPPELSVLPAEVPPPPAPPAAPLSPPEPPKPKVGEKVGFIQLTQKPQPRPGDNKAGGGKPPARTSEPGRTDFIRRGDTRPGRGGPPSAGAPGQRFSGQQKSAGGQRPAELAKPATPKFALPADAQIIIIKPPIVVRELAEQLKQKPFKVIADLMEAGVFANVNQAIDEKIAVQVCAKYGFKFEVEKRAKGEGQVHAPVKQIEVDTEDKLEQLKPRPPVVTIMGHVDHGKTSLLDVIRKANVAAGEAGGITQHIGAYTISFPHPERKNDLQQITFLDTPGHAAFSSMRARGANVTDIVVLVVAANDGVMPQTLEALNHAKAARVPILVAVNKCDHPNANPMKVRQQLQEKGLVPDDWGGETIFVDCSALTKQGVDKLLEMILLQADLLELKANPDRMAKGNVIESGIEPGGPIATVLVRKGTLRVGDVILCGEYYGKARALINEEGNRLKEASPSVAVKILGLNGVPDAGLEFTVCENERTARDLATERAQSGRAESLEAKSKVTLENLFATLDSQAGKTPKVVVKADTQGSVEAICEALKKIESDKVALEVIHSDVGAISENDVALASASHGIILGFHTRLDSTAAEKAKHENVQVKLYAIIYELIDQVKDGMTGLLDPVAREVIVGSAEVRQVFELSKGMPVAGSMVTVGRIVRGKVRVRRRKDVIYEGVTQSLRRFQDEVNEVRAGLECGIRIEGFSEIQVGDVVECYTIEKVAAKL
jgi:translation initiation factor IF-2